MTSPRTLLEELLTKAQLQYDSIEEDTLEDGIVRFNLTSQEPQIAVGKYGETLFALQHLYRIMLHKEGIEQNVIVDVNGYRKKQEEGVISIAETKIHQLKEKGGVVHFAPMASYKRRAIHVHIMDNYPDIITESIGMGLDRKLTIRLKDEQAAMKQD